MDKNNTSVNNILAIFLILIMIISLSNIIFVTNVTRPEFIGKVFGLLKVCISNPPVLDTIGNLNATEDEEFYYDVNSTLENESMVTFSTNTSIFSINSFTGVINFTPSNEDVGNHSIRFSVMETLCNKTDFEDVMFMIQNANNAPILEPIGNRQLCAGGYFYYRAWAYDPDQSTPEGDNLTFGDTTSLFEIDPLTGEISFTPLQNESGNHTFMIYVTDSEGALDSENVTWEVIPSSNNTPQISSIGNLIAYSGVRFRYQVNVTDADGDQLIYTDNTSLFSINSSTGFIDFIPKEEDSGSYWITISAKENRTCNNTDSEVVNFTIVAQNDTDGDGCADVIDPDDDGDGICDGNSDIIDDRCGSCLAGPDMLKGFLRHVATNMTFNLTVNTSVLNISVNNSYNLSQNFTGTLLVNFSKQYANGTSEPLVTFYWNFSSSVLNLTPVGVYDEGVDGDTGYLLIKGLETGNYYTKTVFVNDKSEGKNGVCVRDARIVSISDVSSDCSSGDETFVGCNGKVGNYECTDLGNRLKVTGIVRSGIIEMATPPPPAPEPISPISRGAPCIENWRCGNWSICPQTEIQIRDCWDLSKCNSTIKKPITSRKCIYVPVPTCYDNVLNCHEGDCEILADCGGPCSPCPTCSDGVQNQNETGVDCGASCPPCRGEIGPVVAFNPQTKECVVFTSLTDVPKGWKLTEKYPQDMVKPAGKWVYVVYANEAGECIPTIEMSIYEMLLYICAIALIILMVFFAIRWKAGRPKTTAGISRARKEKLGRSWLIKIAKIKLFADKDPETTLRKFSGGIRKFFAVFLSIKYQFTYAELEEELENRKVRRDIKKKCIALFKDITEMEYGGGKVSAEDIKRVINEGTLLIKELTKSSEHKKRKI